MPQSVIGQQTIKNCTIPYYTILLYCTILYYTVLYYTVPYKACHLSANVLEERVRYLIKSKIATVDNLWYNYSQFVANGSNIKQATKFDNLVNIPLITGAEEPEMKKIFNFIDSHCWKTDKIKKGTYIY